MRSKVQWASAVALAATVLTALISAQGSGAATPGHTPVQAIENSASQAKTVQFVAEPVVQSIPADETVADEGSTDDAPDMADAGSLRELVAQQDMPATLSREMHCLAGAIYFEARGESLEGQLAVGRVIVNRSDSGRFPDSYCGVVLQRSQFSFVRGSAIPKVRTNSEQWRRAVAIAQIADEGLWNSPAKGALFFHAARVSPGWRLTRLARVDNHIFYR